MLQSYLSDFVSLIYPQLCLACGESLIHQEKTLCTSCLYSLPYTDFYKYPDNTIARQFWGRVPVEHALAVWLFYKGNHIQRLMHQLKYNKKKEVGYLLGRLAGKRLAGTPWFSIPDAIIPVPVHPSKKAIRGYNQSEILALGMAEVLNRPVFTDVLLRPGKAKSQTTKSRYERYLNMQDQFLVKNEDRITGKNILLVDDIITTGATLEACISVCLKKKVTISVCAIAHSE